MKVTRPLGDGLGEAGVTAADGVAEGDAAGEAEAAVDGLRLGLAATLVELQAATSRRAAAAATRMLPVERGRT